MFATAIAGGMQSITAPDVCNTVVEPVGALDRHHEAERMQYGRLNCPPASPKE